MSRQAAVREASEEVLRQTGYDSLAIPNMTEKDVVEYLRGLSNYVTPRMVRRAIASRQLKPVRKSNRHYFSKRAALDWLMSSDEPADA